MSLISFAKPSAATQPTPVTAQVAAQVAARVPPAAVLEVVQPEQTSQAEIAAQTQALAPRSNAPASGFYSGEEDDIPTDRGDVRLPRLNIVQGLSGPELKAVGPDGTLVLKKSLALPQPLRIVVCGCSRKRYAEKMAVFGQGDPRIFDTLEEVIEAGGTDQWKQSRENKDSDGMPTSRKPWFQPMVTALLLIQKPEKLAKPEDEEHFTAVTSDGIAFAPCVYTVKSTSFGSFYVPLKSEQSAGVLKNGFFTHYVRLTTKQVRAFEPVVAILEPTPESVRTLARSILN